MRFQAEFARFHDALEVALPDAAKGRQGYESAQVADDALRVLEDHMNELDRALVDIHRAIVEARQ